MLDAAGYNHIGKRESNQDAFLINEALGLYLIADGVGGHAAGEVASELVCQIINQRIAAGSDLVAAIQDAHQSVLDAAKRPDRAGMASTVVALQVKGADCLFAWVGDSRGYLWDGESHRLTQDHTRIQELLDAGVLSHQAAQEHPEKGMLTQALGAPNQSISVDCHRERLRAGETLMLCTDGLSDVIGLELMCAALSRQENAAETAKALVHQAVSEGAQDNCTCLIVRVLSTVDNHDDTAVLHQLD